ncbi:hypothetical protein [Neptunomonas phycophila]|uniref:hypothetical protein n=1 Tax=Neptunomonas phycophila TaxID=1572645 RepID=UPI000948945C|nr:hypothetical protein [Neptunomonas phycophila]
MTSKKIVLISLLTIFLAWFSYWYNFSYLNSYEISRNPEDWAVLGDFLGGVLNPILSFLTIVLLVSSLKIQKESNSHLQSEIEKSERFERVRSFETSFFNMIDSQKVIFDKFCLKFKNSESIELFYSSAAVIELESVLIEMREAGGTNQQIKNAIEVFDENDEIYSVVRTFCVIVKMIDKKLGSYDDFDPQEIKDYYETLINFTDYSLVRLVLVSHKYLNYSVLKSLDNSEFMSVIESVGADGYLRDV